MYFKEQIKKFICLFTNKFSKAEIAAVELDISYVEILKKVYDYLKIKVIRSAIWSEDCYLETEDTGQGKWKVVVEETGLENPKSFLDLD